MRGKELNISLKGRIAALVLVLFLTLTVLAAPVFAWFSFSRILASYAPISKPESLYIGAGHRDFDETNGVFLNDHFEDIRYLYLEGIDVHNDDTYYDYVFCVFGKAITHYRMQLAYTTNNQFIYEIYNATEYTAAEYGALAQAQQDLCVEYTTHDATPATYYYKATGTALPGNYLNAQTVGGETLATDSYHTATYGAYDEVDKFAEPIYWQTRDNINGNRRGDFIHYYILRVYVNNKQDNDRETDVICIAAKSFSAAS
ncbi:MAG: hypothetical protein IKZ81_01380 [Clostridia bacterium]|nr:hypothetical protein [Clostridia bacterium]